MRVHSANDLKYLANIVAADGTTVLASSVWCGVVDLSGRLREQAQLVAPETTHLIVMREGDAAVFSPACYVVLDGVTYVCDYPRYPRNPRPGMWLEIYCHVERSNS